MKKRWILYLVTGVCAITLSACSHEANQTVSSTETQTSSTTTKETTNMYTMTVKEDGTTDQVLVTMEQKTDQNSSQTALGDQDFEGYLLLQDVELKDKDGNPITGDQLKTGDILSVSLTDTPIMAKSMPPKIAGSSIKSIILE